MPKRSEEEHKFQVNLFEWANWQKCRYPDLEMMHAIPNGGHRHIGTARKLKAEGVKSGIPDVFLPAPRGQYHGMYLELKVGKNQPTPNQRLWLNLLRDQGYYTCVVYNIEDTIKKILDYLKL